jgi:hypothetical protein
MLRLPVRSELLADVIRFTLADAADAEKPYEPCDFWRLLDDPRAAPHTWL